MIEPLPFKKIKFRDNLPWRSRVMFFDPKSIYERVKPNPYERIKSIPMNKIFLNNKDGKCSCGCGLSLTGRQTRWARMECHKFAMDVWSIICGHIPVLQSYLREYYGWNCFECGCRDKGKETRNGVISDIHIDHVIPVKLGGGACWLSNYQLLCSDCHKKKTIKDFNWKLPKILKTAINQPTLFP